MIVSESPTPVVIQFQFRHYYSEGVIGGREERVCNVEKDKRTRYDSFPNTN